MTAAKGLDDMMVAVVVGQAIEDVTGPLEDILIEDSKLGTHKLVKVTWMNGMSHGELYDSSAPIQGMINRFQAHYVKGAH